MSQAQKATGSKLQKSSASRLAALMFRLAVVMWILLALWPISYGITRAAQVVLLVIMCAGGLFLWWRRQWVRWTILSLMVLCTAVVVWPARTMSHEKLRQRYVRELQGFVGVRYVWGGETGLGIDCSGLVRRAWIKTLFKEAVLTANPGLIRKAAAVWWYDSSARALAAEYRGETIRLFEAERITELDPMNLLPGDLAVTSDGVHALAYLGGNQWIEADPSERKVITISALQDDNLVNGWLKVPVTILRWRLIASSPDSFNNQ
ncbi:MAG: NlpC/P60 family protein [Limisphaerales bacterium]